jgi:hypothetical protein
MRITITMKTGIWVFSLRQLYWWTDYWADDTLGNYKFTIEDIDTVIEIKS